MATSKTSILTEADRKNFASAYDSGELQSTLAKRYGLTPAAVRQVIQELGLTKRPPIRLGRPRLSVPLGTIESMLADYDSGMSIEALQAKHGLPLSRIYASLRKAGKPFRRTVSSASDELSEETKTKIIAMNRDEGIPSRRIADDLNLSRHAVETVLKRILAKPVRAVLAGEEGEQLRDRVRQLYTGTDLTIVAIAETMGVGISTVTRLVRTLDVPKRGTPKGRRHKPHQ